MSSINHGQSISGGSFSGDVNLTNASSGGTATVTTRLEQSRSDEKACSSGPLSSKELFYIEKLKTVINESVHAVTTALLFIKQSKSPQAEVVHTARELKAFPAMTVEQQVRFVQSHARVEEVLDQVERIQRVASQINRFFEGYCGIAKDVDGLETIVYALIKFYKLDLNFDGERIESLLGAGWFTRSLLERFELAGVGEGLAKKAVIIFIVQQIDPRVIEKDFEIHSEKAVLLTPILNLFKKGDDLMKKYLREALNVACGHIGQVAISQFSKHEFSELVGLLERNVTAEHRMTGTISLANFVSRGERDGHEHLGTYGEQQFRLDMDGYTSIRIEDVTTHAETRKLSYELVLSVPESVVQGVIRSKYNVQFCQYVGQEEGICDQVVNERQTLCLTHGGSGFIQSVGFGRSGFTSGYVM